MTRRTDELEQVGAVPVLFCAAGGAPIDGDRAAGDLVGAAFSHGAQWIAVPVGRLPEEFFRLRTRLAGDVVQKFATYRLGLAVLGDISGHLESGTALRDFVRESNRGTQLWFLPDEDALRAKLL
ncbi:DUF4180 domain-containing protein [Kitasatospora terrestris]|uniref:DUF4180 domain-containing protein n=1 Tax=Kitasatospora terrestris TaxID=258051 RepID=A0ABP9DJS9_9ACTN